MDSRGVGRDWMLDCTGVEMTDKIDDSKMMIITDKLEKMISECNFVALNVAREEFKKENGDRWMPPILLDNTTKGFLKISQQEYIEYIENFDGNNLTERLVTYKYKGYTVCFDD